LPTSSQQFLTDRKDQIATSIRILVMKFQQSKMPKEEVMRASSESNTPRCQDQMPGKTNQLEKVNTREMKTTTTQNLN